MFGKRKNESENENNIGGISKTTPAPSLRDILEMSNTHSAIDTTRLDSSMYSASLYAAYAPKISETHTHYR